ncbi:asialoglycoprotein receptor 1-like [Egretta garzetta]|uniref:asialoglycoprotein receptor 1-like n=1 Tax=Egretta garzetta TaxID=188379 RepID=UPI00163C7FE9|nr:asialoglycoprotein receptor 1-like [Egretta garzetta]
MSQGEGAVGTYKKWDFNEEMESEKQERRKAPKGVLSLLAAASPERAMARLYVLLALAFLLFMVLTIVNLRRVSAVWEALEQAQMRSKSSHTTAWHNLSEVQRTLDKQLSSDLKAIHGRLLNVSQEVENMQKVMWQKEECGKELSDRLRALEERDAPEPVLRQLAEVKQEQSRASALLDAALEETRNLSKILCASCPDGWQQFAKTCYFFSTIAKPWLEAKDSCAEFNAHLAVVNTEQENVSLEIP